VSKNDGLYAGAVEKYLAGDVAGASKLCQKILGKDQKDDRVLNLFGLIQQAQGSDELAVSFFEKAVKSNPKNIEALTNLANSFQLQKEYVKALEIYQRIIELKPNFAKAYYNMALALIEIGDTSFASKLLQKSIVLDGDFTDSYINLANIYKKDGDMDRAHEVLIDGRRVLKDTRLDLSLALILSEQKKHEEAICLAKEAVGRDKTPQSLNDLGIVYYAAKLYDEAIARYLEALALKPDFANCYSNLANAFLDKGDEHFAKGALLKAISLDPNRAQSYVNYGVYAKKICDLEGAREAFQSALHLDPSNGSAATNLGILYMYEGDYGAGLPLYEKRKKPFIKCDKPRYNGQDLVGKTLFVYHEQGFGDTINFARLLKHPRLSKANILFMPQKELLDFFDADLLGVRLVGIDEVVGGAMEFDYHTPLLSLLYFFDISLENIPENIDFSHKNESKIEYFKNKMAGVAEKKIGIAWQGNKDYTGDRERSVEMELFMPFLEKGYALVAINKDFDIEEFEWFAKGKQMFEFSKDLGNFNDTSALLDCLDMVVSIDTSVAHLAASKNIPTFVLLPKMADWRWGATAENSLWYKSVTLCRQRTRGDWIEAIKKVLNSI
jgi:tetratricopeptide (TPR) repeat protein